MSFADFYALMPSDNADPIAPGADVAFPQNGAILNTDIGRVDDSSFLLNVAGIYLVQFQASVAEEGQLVLALDDVELPYTVVGRSATSSQIVGIALVAVETAGSTLSVRNPAANVGSLTLTPDAGGTQPVSAHLVITRLS